MAERRTLGAADYAVCLATLLVSSGIGVYYRLTGGKQKTTQEYLLADRSQRVLPVAVSLMASFMSSITLLGVPAEFYVHGTQFTLIDLGYVLLAPVAARLYLPVFFRMEATSAYEYLLRRFGAVARTAASLVYTAQMVLYMGVVLYAPAVALHALTALSQESAILIVGVVCIFYSTLGGMKAVIVTDVFQAVLMYAAVLLVVVTAAVELGGLGPIWRIAEERGRIEFFNFSLDPTVRHTVWGLLFGGGFQFLSLYAVNQTQIQRYLSMKDLGTAVKALYLSVPILIVLSFTTSFSGLALFSKYRDCDPVKSGRIPSSDQLMPLYILETAGGWPGATGLFVSGIFSAALSTVSALLNALSAVTLEDYIKPAYACLTGRQLADGSRTVVLSKLLALLYGVVCLAVAFVAKHLGSVLQATLTIFGAVGGPLLGIFTLGMFLPLANEPGAVTGMVAGLAVSLWLGFGGPKPPVPGLPVSVAGCPAHDAASSAVSAATAVLANFTSATAAPPAAEQQQDYLYVFRLSYLWYIVIGFAITMVVGVLFSLLCAAVGSPKRADQLDPDLFTPPVAAYLRRRAKTDAHKFGADLTAERSRINAISYYKEDTL